MKIEHLLTDPDVDLAELTRRVGEKTGQELCFVSRAPADGVPGVLMFEDPATTERIPVETRIVVSTIDELAAERVEAQRQGRARHERALAEELAQPDLSNYANEQLDAFDAALDDADRWAAVRAVLAHAADQEARFNEQVLTEWRAKVEHHQTCRRCNPTEMPLPLPDGA